ncbi:hypothetical protein PsYK624_049710 [Phanerochaete sordida]|uniref:SMP domain-containing protein n=1 Tax=Phanerochaete sordida TaxID=48140 RepID=A0A9P3LBT9_9APHY|nr:hypothetical protein PsYK624_049710 [Phanerochaete sordida]
MLHMSTPAPHILGAAHHDAAHFVPRIDLKTISEAEARTLMSVEHKALGYRPPPGSLAAEAQAEAAKHPQTAAQISEEALRLAALADAERIKNERGQNGVDLSAVGDAQARKIMSEEHKALGHRPPPGSLASQAQSAAAKHPNGASLSLPGAQTLTRAALEDATALESAAAAEIDLNFIGEVEARKLMSEEHKALGYRPPQGSLAAAAQAAAAKHPSASAGIEPARLVKAALDDAKKIETQRRASQSPTSEPELNLETISADEARALQSEEQKVLGYRPPADSLAAQAQSAVDRRADEVTTTEGALQIQSEGPEAHEPSLETDGGAHTFGELGL